MCEKTKLTLGQKMQRAHTKQKPQCRTKATAKARACMQMQPALRLQKKAVPVESILMTEPEILLFTYKHTKIMTLKCPRKVFLRILGATEHTQSHSPKDLMLKSLIFFIYLNRNNYFQCFLKGAAQARCKHTQ